MKLPDKLTLVFIIVLFTLNCISLYEFSVLSFRILRAAVSAIVLIAYLVTVKNKKIITILVLALMLTSDLLLINYENGFFKIAHYIARGTSYLLIAFQIRKYIARETIPAISWVYLILVMGFLYFLLSTLGGTFAQETDNTLIISLFYFQGTAASIMFLLAVLYLESTEQPYAVFGFFPGLGFIIADLAAFVAYHLDFSYFYIFDRLFYILALASYFKHQYSTIAATSQRKAWK
ncbi:hypothetical protein C7S20_07585 [Christiangramia fulva]|uniref:Lysoplasmalogenase n=1 Tax=Christiangramia fulva TaxID=2126553 RepID=A0A2R3Z4D5_9FLAO|nr:hypothetical protein [Christiangramia fulva]AVR45143.1 hypothetical protein C7S20_07585 [Christiangramia fulva]